MNSRLPPEAFEYYFSLGTERSYQAVADHYGSAKITVTRRAKEEDWQERLRGLEQQARDKSEKRIVEEMDAVRERHVKAAKFLQAKAIEALKTLPADQAVRAATALSIGWKHELLILGEPTDRQATVEEVIKREYDRWLVPVEDEADDEVDDELKNEVIDEPADSKSPPRSRLDKLRFFKDLGYEPHPGQVEIHKSRAPRRIVACGVRWGKTLASAMEGVAAAMEPRDRSIGWVVAPTYDLADRVFREIQLIAFQHIRHRVIQHKEHERRIVLRNMGGGVSEIRAKTADNPVSLLGEGLDWLIIDEAARLKPTIWQSHLSQRLIDKRGWALLISTPKGKGYFFDLWRRGQGNDSDYESWNLPSWTNPLLDADVIEEERGRLPERVFMQEYGAEFVEGAGAVFRNVRVCATAEYQGPQSGERYYGGLDLAKVEDFTVFIILNKKREVVYFDRFHRIDWSQQVQRIKVASERFRCSYLHVDSTGKGEPVHEALEHEGVFCTPYPFTSKSKSALIDGLAIDFEKRAITIPRPEICPELVDELEGFEYSITDSGNVRTSAPSGQHDDCVIALALALWPIRTSRPDTRTVQAQFM